MRCLIVLIAFLACENWLWASGPYSASAPQGCGELEIAGIIAFHESKLTLKVHPMSQDETLLTLSDSFQLRAAPYLDRPVVIRGLISRPIQAYRGSIEAQSIQDRVPDPLRPQYDSGFHLIRRRECAKKALPQE